MADYDGTLLAVGSVKGQREWTVDALGRLSSLNFRSIWTPDENLAECLVGSGWRTSPEHDAPGEDCRCGFYGYHQGGGPEASFPHGSPRRVRGIIEGYGVTVIGELGFRCGKARIIALLDPDYTPRLRHNYPAVEFYTSREAMLAAHDLSYPFEITPETDDTFWTRAVPKQAPEPCVPTSYVSGGVVYISGGWSSPPPPLNWSTTTNDVMTWGSTTPVVNHYTDPRPNPPQDHKRKGDRKPAPPHGQSSHGKLDPRRLP